SGPVQLLTREEGREDGQSQLSLTVTTRVDLRAEIEVDGGTPRMVGIAVTRLAVRLLNGTTAEATGRLQLLVGQQSLTAGVLGSLQSATNGLHERAQTRNADSRRHGLRHQFVPA